MTEVIQPSNELKIFVGGLEIIGNGTIPSVQNKLAEIHINDLVLRFEFNTDNTKEAKIQRKIENKTLILSLTNFNNSLGTGIIEPFHVGQTKNRLLYLSFWVWDVSSDKGERLINWTLLQGNETKKNQD